jgi:lipopolysaccharide/colanic/teichoic acid biosynthesis glycosyltransferase
MHTILLLNGFEHMQDAGTKMISCSPSVFKVMPQPVKDSKLASIATDLESIKSIGKILFKDSLDHLPHINSFLNSGVDFVNPNPIDDWKQYGSALDKEFGKRTFVVWDDFIAD